MTQQKKMNDKIREFFGVERWLSGDKTKIEKDVCNERMNRELLIQRYIAKYPPKTDVLNERSTIIRL